MFSEVLTLISRDLASIGHIALVSDENARNVVRSVLLDFVHPSFDGTEAFAVCDVISHNDTVGALVVAASDCFESFLSGGIPNLQLDGLSVNFDSSNFLNV